MTELLAQADAYLRSAAATVLASGPDGVVLDRTPFYPQGGGQPGDGGMLRHADGREVVVAETVYAGDRKSVLHRLADGAGSAFSPRDRVVASIDWGRRLPRMRIHTTLHLLTTVLRFPVTGGSVGDGEGRLDFDMPDGIDARAVEADLNALIARDLPVTTRFITDEELLGNPGLVKTMSVRPPMGTGRIRLVAIGDVDLQPCGGTHVASTAEIGPVRITGIEKKGKQNRRVRVALAERDIP